MMKNIDVEIYLNQLISFFDKNPNDLMVLIGDTFKDLFYEKVREQCLKNLDSGDEISLTQQQIIDIVVSIKKEEVKQGKVFRLHNVFEQNKIGIFCLN
jgi:hypothetical protein